jgi:Zn-dependent protease with chaperone function
MALQKKRRVAFAVAFLTAVIAAVKALGNATVFWPLSALWQQLRGPQRFQLVGGCVLAILMLVLFFWSRSREASSGEE